MAPRAETRAQLAGAARAALGGGRRLEAAERIAGGSKKGVYRLVMDDSTTAIAYLWDDAENYWPTAEGDDDLTDPFAPGLGLDLFEAAHARLDALGVRVPAIRLVDRDGVHCPADLAIVEDLPGENLEDLLARDPSAAAPVMARLGESLEAMRRHRAPTYGKVAVVDGEVRRAGRRASRSYWTARCVTSPRRRRVIRGSRERATGWRNGCGAWRRRCDRARTTRSCTANWGPTTCWWTRSGTPWRSTSRA